MTTYIILLTILWISLGILSETITYIKGYTTGEYSSKLKSYRTFFLFALSGAIGMLISLLLPKKYAHESILNRLR